MFRGQQTRSLNIGCLGVPKSDNTPYKNSEIHLDKDLRKSKMGIQYHSKYINILSKTSVMPPSLLELCKRKLYDAINTAAKKLNAQQNICFKSNYNDFEINNNINNLQDHFKDINMNNNKPYTNGNEISSYCKKNKIYSSHCVPSNIVDEYFSYLPRFIKQDFCNGPLSRCENVTCKTPLFDYVYLEFCLERITLIENTEEVVLCGALCSKTCVDTWQIGKSIINYT